MGASLGIRAFDRWDGLARFGTGAAMAVTLGLQLLFFRLRPPATGDAGNYLLNVVALVRGDLHAIDPYWSPLYSALGAIPVGLGLDPLDACRWVNLLATVALVPATAWLAAKAFDRRAALLSAWIVGLSPLAHAVGVRVLSEPSATVIVVLALALALPGRGAVTPRGAIVRYLVAGFLAVVATSGRNELVFSVFAVAGFAWMAAGRHRRRSVTAAVTGIALGAAVLGSFLQATGDPGRYLTKGQVNVTLAAKGLLVASSPERESALYALNPENERTPEDTPRGSIPSLIPSLVRHFSHTWPDAFAALLAGCGSPLLLLLAPLGLWGRHWHGRSWLIPGTLIVGAAVPLIAASATVPYARYLLPTIPFLAVLAAGGVTGVIAGERESPSAERGERTPRGSGPLRGRGVLIWSLLLVLLPAPWTCVRPVRILRSIPTVYAGAGRWIQANLPPGRVLARAGTYVAYYAGHPEHTFIPAAPVGDVVAWARERDFRYLVVDTDLPVASRPGVERLLRGDPELARELGVHQVYVDDEEGMPRVVVYEITG